MYKQLKRQLDDKRVLEDQIRGLEDRIKFKIQKQLGLRATSYAELKIECPTVEDKFARVFSEIEELDNDLQNLKEELKIINDTLDRIDKSIATMNDIEKKVFRCRYIWGLTVKQTAERLSYSEDHIKDISKKIGQKWNIPLLSHPLHAKISTMQ